MWDNIDESVSNFVRDFRRKKKKENIYHGEVQYFQFM